MAVSAPNERLFTLSPVMIPILPGQAFQTSLSIPAGVQSWKIRFSYDSLVVKFDSIIQSTNGIIVTSSESAEQLVLSGMGENGTVLLNFNTFLPYNSDTAFAMNLAVDTAQQSCENTTVRGSTLLLGMFCGLAIRTVSNTGKSYFIASKESGVNFGIGLSGKVRLELYDYTGELKEVLIDGALEAGEYSIDFDLPTGIYFCRISAGMFNDAQKIMILHSR